MSRSIKYEVVNPDAPWSMTSTSELHAAAAVILLTVGRYALRELSEDLKPNLNARLICPPFFASGDDGLDEWWREQIRTRAHTDEYRDLAFFPGKAGFDRWVTRELRGIADALDSVTLEGPERRNFPMGDLRFEASQLATQLRETIEKGLPQHEES